MRAVKRLLRKASGEEVLSMDVDTASTRLFTALCMGAKGCDAKYLLMKKSSNFFINSLYLAL